MAIADKLNELIQERDNLANNLNTMGVSASTEEKLSTLIPKVLDIQTGGGSEMDDYFKTSGFTTIANNNTIYGQAVKKLPDLNLTLLTTLAYAFYNFKGDTIPNIKTRDDVTNFSSMFYGCSNITTVPRLNTSKGTSFSSMFYGCGNITEIPDMDTSSATNFQSMFSNCYNLKSIPNLNTSNVKNISYMFNECMKLNNLPLLDFGSVNTASNAFTTNTALTNVAGFKDLGKGYTRKSSNYSDYTFAIGGAWPKITHDSLMNVINNLYDLNLTYDVANGGTLYTQKLKLGEKNLAKLTAEEIAIATAKGWTVS